VSRLLRASGLLSDTHESCDPYTLRRQIEEAAMRTNIEIDDELMKRAMATAGAVTKKDAVDAALKLMVRLGGQSEIRKWRGKIQWEGDLESSRLNRFTDLDKG
jgi:Arc/MetJ family transcription regulator